MARIYDVVCPNCGEVLQWCKYDAPLDECTYCGSPLSHIDSEGDLVWNEEVEIFGVGSTSEDVEYRSKELRTKFLQEYNPSKREKARRRSK